MCKLYQYGDGKYLWRKIGSEYSRDFERVRHKSLPRTVGPSLGENLTEPMSDADVERLFGLLVCVCVCVLVCVCWCVCVGVCVCVCVYVCVWV